jgi:hypothetical protein
VAAAEHKNLARIFRRFIAAGRLEGGAGPCSFPKFTTDRQQQEGVSNDPISRPRDVIVVMDGEYAIKFHDA